MLDWLNREELLIGKANTKKLLNSTVAIFGCGGVGSYAVEGLARAGIGNFILVDKDIVDITNINRQLIADITTIGKDKVEIEKRRILNIKEISVKKGEQRQGIGKKLYNEMTKLVKKQDIDSIELLVWRFNRESIKFYESLNMKVKNIRFEQKLHN